MSLNGKACIVGIHEHPIRRADGLTTAQRHADVALGQSAVLAGLRARQQRHGDRFRPAAPLERLAEAGTRFTRPSTVNGRSATMVDRRADDVE